MKILFITPSPPSRFHRVRALNIIKHLGRTHELYLLSLCRERNPDASAYAPYLKAVHFVRQPPYASLLYALAYLPTTVPLEVAYCRNRRMERMARSLVRKYGIDIVYVKRLRAAQFARGIEDIPVVIDTTDAMSMFYARAARRAPFFEKLLYFEEWLSYGRYEKKMLRRRPHWIASSPVDAAYLEERAPEETRIHVVPNGVDAEYYGRAPHDDSSKIIIVSGIMDKFVNTEAARAAALEIFPRIAAKVPRSRLLIVGPRPARAVRALASGNVVVTGEVPDIRHYIAQSAVVAVPTRTGAGTRNKILQAWSMGRPVVSTSRGAEGLDCRDGGNILIADDPDEFADAVVRLFSNAALRERLIREGRRTVEEKYSMSVVAKGLSALLEDFRAVS